MPLYEYECDACGQHFELIRRFSDPEVDVCAACGKGPVRRLLSSPAIQFKGSGWYITDYARKAKSESAGGKSAESKGAAPDSKAADAKTDGAAKSDAGSSTTSTSTSSTGTKP